MNKPTTLDELLKEVKRDIIYSNRKFEGFAYLGAQRENCESYLRSLCEKALKNGYELSNDSSDSADPYFLNIWGQATIERADFLRILRSFNTDKNDGQAFPKIIETIMEGIVSSFPYGEIRLNEIFAKLDEYRFSPCEVAFFLEEDYFAEEDFDCYFDHESTLSDIFDGVTSTMSMILDWLAKRICLRMDA